MASRLDLQSLLESILGSRNVYFQPPASIQMRYPAIVYSLYDIDNTFADNSVYAQTNAYTVTVVDKNPDSEYVKKISMLPMCNFERHYAVDNLNHYVFVLYF